MSQARGVALEAIYRVNEDDAYSNLVLDELLAKSNLSRADKGLVTQILYGSLRYRNSLDWIINQFASQKVADMTPWVRNALRMGVYQLQYLDKVPDHAACNETVEVAKKHCNRGALGFINAILRNILRQTEKISFPDLEQDPVQHIRYTYSFPQWMIERWVKDFGVEKTVELAKSLNTEVETFLRTNFLTTEVKQLIAKLEEEGVEAEHYPLSSEFNGAVSILKQGKIDDLSAYQQGMFQVQGLSSMLVSHILDPKSDEFIIDLCAGLGGKTTHLAELMNNQGEILAVDIHQNKLEKLTTNAKRLGIKNIRTKAADGRKVKTDQLADKILIDAPCSGFGVINKKPEIKWQRKPQDIDQLAKLQVELLAHAAKQLKAGGEIIYSTCTFNQRENEAVIASFKEEHQNFEVVNLASRAVELGVADSLENDYLKLLTKEKFDKFFIAKLRKNNNFAGEANE